MATLITVDGTKTTRLPKHGSAFTLKELQEAVGGYIEFLHLIDGTVVVLDEDGKAKGRELNMSATDLCAPTLGPWDAIVGDVLVCSPTEVA
jgi:hypothetical protein